MEIYGNSNSGHMRYGRGTSHKLHMLKSTMIIDLLLVSNKNLQSIYFECSSTERDIASTAFLVQD